MIVDKERPKFLSILKGRKSEKAMVYKTKRRNTVDTTFQNLSCLLLRLKSRLEKDAISSGPK